MVSKRNRNAKVGPLTILLNTGGNPHCSILNKSAMTRLTASGIELNERRNAKWTVTPALKHGAEFLS